MTPTLITIETARPRGTFNGQVAQAYFVVKDNRLTLTDRDGNKLYDADGGDYSRVLTETDNPRQVAGRLLKSFRNKFRGERANGFGGPIVYPKLGKI